MISFIRRHSLLTPALVVLVIAACIFWVVLTTFVIRHSAQALPYGEVVTTRCVGPDGQPVGNEYGHPCGSGTTPDTVVIQSHLP
jgi:hypothetical protein